MGDFSFDKKGTADLKKSLSADFKKAEVEANKAADRESSPAGKARAYARVLRKHGVKNVNEARLRHKFGG